MAFSIFNFKNITIFPAVNATYVEGPITQDTIWTLVDSPFVVSNDIMVYPSATLTIEPGVKVKFGGAFSLIILGRLYANGTNKIITFTSNRESPVAGDWNAIIFNGVENSKLINCSIAYAKDGILVENSQVEIKESTVSLCSQNGITITEGTMEIKDCNVSLCSQNGITATDSIINVQNCNVNRCSQIGISVANGTSIIQNTLIMENGINGIKVTGNCQATIQGNTVMANGNGILLTGNETSGVNISQNKISANRQSGILIDAQSHFDITIVNNIISSNDKGLYISSSTSTYITNNSISYNNIGILYDQGNHDAHYNDIYGNEVGMDVASNVTVDAEHNYWGDKSGPYHESLNPGGKGNRVGGDGVSLDFIFFLTKPIGYINTRPTATLLTDKILVPPNEIVMFFATNSFDSDGRVDRYFLDFGDGRNSGWTTLSIFIHKYSSPWNYSANLRVIDDNGTLSNVAITTIYVNETFPSLYVRLELSNSVVHEDEQVSITVYVMDGTVAVENAIVTIFSVKGGNFTESSGLTNIAGYFVTTFNAPDITEKANIRIVARASKSGYADGSDYEYVEVSPFLSVQVTANPDVIKSEETTQILIHVRSNGESIANASVMILSSGGSLSSETGITDSNGMLSIVFTAPQTTTFLNVTITVIATKSDYMNGVGQTIIAIEPKILAVEITAESTVTISEAKINLTVHVGYEMVPIAGANVTMMAENGNFSISTELTNSYGNVTFVFTAPQVSGESNITVTARATKAGYAEGQNQLEITVNPRTFNIKISASTVKSGESTIVAVSVTCIEDATPVADAVVTISSSDGNFSVTNQTTNPTGVCTFIFDAPQTTVQLPVIITANVTRNGYIDGGNQTVVTVTPKTTPQAEGGWPITTILLIIIPIVIVVVVMILIKLKIIVVSAEEEE